ncbi:MAG: glycosyltransferase family 2 protein, partial [Thermoleophilaceae bacterium]
VTVVIPVKDRPELLRQTLRSVAEQTQPPAEVVVADDGSTDSTPEVAREDGARVIRNAEGGWGPSAARNAGLAEVRTPYVAFLDSDDLLLPGAHEVLRGALERDPAAPFAYGQAIAAGRDGDAWRLEGVIAARPDELRDPVAAIFVRNHVPSSGALARTEEVRAIGGYDQGLVFDEDHDLWIRLGARGRPAHVEEVVAIHRRHPGNRGNPLDAIEDELAVVSRADSHDGLAAHRPDRLGVLLCEVAIGAVHRRSLRELAGGVSKLLVRQPRRLRIMRTSATYFSARRASGRQGERLWQERTDIRHWLSGYR